MKTLLTLIATLLITLTATAQPLKTSFYLRAGASTLHSFQHPRFSWEGGAALAFKPSTTWAIHASLGYALRGLHERLIDDDNSYEGFSGTSTQRFHYINLDLTGAYHLSDHFSLHLGPYFAYQITAAQEVNISYLLNGTREEENVSTDIAGIYHPEDFGALFQVRVLPVKALAVELTLRQGLRELRDPSISASPNHTQSATLGLHYILPF